jgi:hypothetical protein
VAKLITITDIELLKKVLAQTTSDNDNIVVVAVRKANAILNKHGITWSDVLSKTVQAATPTFRAEEPRKHKVHDVEEDSEIELKAQIETAFKVLDGKVHGDFGTFVLSLKKQFEEKGYLTPRQRAPLFKAAQRELDR